MKDKKTIGIVVIVISLILLGTGGFLTYQSMNDSNEGNNKPSDEQNNNNQNDNTDNNENEDNDLSYLVNDTISKDDVTKLNERMDKINPLMAAYYTDNEELNIPNQQLLVFGYTNTHNEKNSKEAMDKVINSYFGKNVSVVYEDIICNVENEVIYKYDEENKKYVDGTYVHAHGGSGTYPEYVDTYYIENITKENDKYIVNAKVVYGTCDDICSHDYIPYYATTDTKNVANKMFEVKPSMNEIKDKGNLIPTTTYTFVKENNEFVLQSVKVSKEQNNNNTIADEEKLNEKILDINTIAAPYYTNTGMGKVPNQNLLWFTLKKVPNSYSEGHSVSESELNNILKSYFGGTQTITHENYFCSQKIPNTIVYTYNQNTHMYTYSNECGIEVDFPVAHNAVYIENIETNGNEYVVKAKVAYGYCKDVCGPIPYYATFNDALNGTNKVFDTEPTKDEIKEKSSSLPTTTYTFTKENNDFVLKDIKIK